MYIPYDDTQNYPFCRLKSFVDTFDTQLNKLNNQNSVRNPKDDEPTNKKILL